MGWRGSGSGRGEEEKVRGRSEAGGEGGVGLEGVGGGRVKVFGVKLFKNRGERRQLRFGLQNIPSNLGICCCDPK